MLRRVVRGLVIGLALAGWCALAAPAYGSPDSAGPAHGGAGGEEGIGVPPLDSWRGDLALWTGVVFLVLLGVLWKFAWAPLAQGLNRREQGIADQIAQAEQANREAKDLLAEYGRQLAGAKDEVRGMFDQARRDADQLGREMLEKAKQEARAEQQRAVQQIDAATANAIKELAEQSANLAVELAGKIVRAELRPDDHAQLIQQAIADFAQQSPSEN